MIGVSSIKGSVSEMYQTISLSRLTRATSIGDQNLFISTTCGLGMKSSFLLLKKGEKKELAGRCDLFYTKTEKIKNVHKRLEL